MRLIRLIAAHKTKIVLAFILVIIGVISAGLFLAPQLFYDQWIWKYYWGPIVADATGHSVSHNGIVANEGYTIVSEITYGLILVSALYGIYQLLKKLKITIDWRFCVALLPYILFGPVTRVLEDTNYFAEPVVYWFISPLIYLQTTAYVLFFLFLGWFLQKKAWNRTKTISALALVFFFLNCFYTSIWFLEVQYGAVRIEPLPFYLFSFIAFLPLLYRTIKKQAMTTNTVIFSGGLFVLLPCCFLIGRWLLGEQWSRTYGAFPNVFLLIVGLVALIVALVFLVARAGRSIQAAAAYRNPLNLSMLAGHLIDGLTTYISIYDPLRMGLPTYLEKHPASDMLLGVWPPLFPIVKFLLIMLVIYVFDILYKEELRNHLQLVNLLKISIFILGVSPGIRGLLRVTMGV